MPTIVAAHKKTFIVCLSDFGDVTWLGFIDSVCRTTGFEFHIYGCEVSIMLLFTSKVSLTKDNIMHYGNILSFTSPSSSLKVYCNTRQNTSLIHFFKDMSEANLLYC